MGRKRARPAPRRGSETPSGKRSAGRTTRAHAPRPSRALHFALAHVAYVAACLAMGVALGTGVAAAAGLTLVALRVWRWLSPHVPAAMRWPVRGYIVVITAMVACALGAWTRGAPAGLPLGAVLFFLSDLSVARERFVVSSTLNRFWGLPAYYAGQLLIASAVVLPPALA